MIWSRGTDLMIVWPISVEPVKPSFLTRPWSAIAWVQLWSLQIWHKLGWSWWISWSRQVPRLTCFQEQVGWGPWLILINLRMILINVLINHRMALMIIQRAKLLPGHTSFQCQGGRWSHQGGNLPPLSARRTSKQSMGTPGHRKYYLNIFLILTWAGLITTVFPAARQAAIFHESIIRG